MSEGLSHLEGGSPQGGHQGSHQGGHQEGHQGGHQGGPQEPQQGAEQGGQQTGHQGGGSAFPPIQGLVSEISSHSSESIFILVPLIMYIVLN